MAIKLMAATRLIAQSKATPWGEGYQNGVGDNTTPCRYAANTDAYVKWHDGYKRGIEDRLHDEQ